MNASTAFQESNLKDKSRELIEFTGNLNQEYAQLLETSRVLRRERKALSEESRRLRQVGFRLSLALKPS